MGNPNPPAAPSNDGARPRLPWESPAGRSAPPTAASPRPAGAGGGEPTADAHYFQQVKSRVHRQLIERLNLSNLDRVSREQVVEAIRKVVHDLISQEMVALNFEERETLVGQVLDEIFGLG